MKLSRFSLDWIAVIAVGLGVVAGPGRAMAQQPLGIDVSSYQGTINWTDVKSAGFSFAWAKATEGTFYIDAYFTGNEANAKAAGIDIGAYHFAHPEEDINDSGADAEAAYFWDEAKNYLTGGTGHLVPMLDLEETYSTETYMSDWVNEWCNDVKNYAAANGAVCNPVVYTEGSIANDYMNSSVAANWPLDIADPGYSDPQGDSPGISISPWSDWTFWQYSWTGSVSGISGDCDEDIIDGTASTLAKFVISTTGTVAGPGVKLEWGSSGGGGGGTWNTSTANWLLSGTGAVSWSTGGDYAEFAGTAGTVTLGTDVTADGLTFDTAGYTIAGSSEILTLNSPGNISVPPGSPTYMSCVLTGVGYNLSGGGVFVLENANNNSGSGTSAEYIIGPNTCLVVDNDTDVGGAGITLNLQDGGIFQDNDSTSGDQFMLPGSAFALLSGGGVFDNPNANLTMTNYITGPGSLTIIGTSYTLTLTDTGNNYTGGTIVQSGTLKANAAGVMGSASGPLTVSGGTLNLNGVSHTAGAVTISAGTIENGTLTGSSYTGEGGTVSAVLAGSGAWTQTSGTNTLSGANIYTGITTINDGLMQITNDNNLGAAPGSPVANRLTLNNTSTGNYGLRAQSDSFSLSANRGITLGANGGSIQVQDGYTLTVPGIITGSSGLLCGTSPTIGEGTLILSGANTYTGSTSIAAGTLQLGANGSLPSTTALTVASAGAGGIFNLNNYSQTIGSLASSAGINGTGTTTPTVELGSGTLTVNGTSSTTFGGVISGSGSLVITGAGGILALTGANTYTAGTTVEGGATLSIDADSGLGATSATLTLNDGCLKNDDSAPTTSTSRTISLGASGGYLDAGWAPSEPVTIAGPITGTGMLYINLDGSPVVLTSTGNTYSGGTTIGVLGPGSYSPGTQAWLKLGANNALPSGSSDGNVTINGTYFGLLDLAGFSQTINGLSGTGTINNSTGAGSLSVGGNNQTSTFSGVIENTGGTLTLTKAGTGVLTLSGANTYSGNTTISSGTLALGSGGSINSTPTISIAAGATFDVSAIASYALSSSTTLSASGTASAATIKGGTTVSLGSQPIILAYNGSSPALTISQGTLSLNGNAFTVNGSQLTGGQTYTIIQQTSGNITSSGSYSVTGTAIGAAGTTAAISVSGGNVILTITDTTTTTLNSLTASTYGQSVTFTATVVPTPAGGMVQFYDNAVALGGPVAVSGGQASYTTNTLSVGNHPITAAYSGITGYAASATASSSTQQVVLPPNSAPVTINSATFLSNGGLQLNFTGIPGYTYWIQATTNLNAPITWTNLSTNTADINGLFNFIDPSANNYLDHYYRTEIP